MTRVLMVISAADTLALADGTAHPTGFWAEEVVAGHRVLRDAGLDVTLATPGGRAPTVDPLSLSTDGGVEPETAAGLRTYLDALADELAHPAGLDAIDATTFDAVFVPGGHAPMTDLTTDADLGRLLVAADAAGHPVAAVCHGVAGLLSAQTADGWLYAGRRLTGFSDVEEQQGGYGDAIGWSVEQRLAEAGGDVRTGAPWSDTVVVDGTLVTGQNPQSTASAARALVDLLH